MSAYTFCASLNRDSTVLVAAGYRTDDVDFRRNGFVPVRALASMARCTRIAPSALPHTLAADFAIPCISHMCSRLQQSIKLANDPL